MLTAAIIRTSWGTIVQIFDEAGQPVDLDVADIGVELSAAVAGLGFNVAGPETRDGDTITVNVTPMGVPA